MPSDETSTEEARRLIAERAAADLVEGERVVCGPGLADRVAELALERGAEVLPPDPVEEPTDLTVVVEARCVDRRGRVELAGGADDRTREALRALLPEAGRVACLLELGPDGPSPFVDACGPSATAAGCVDRVVTERAVLDIRPDDRVVLRELAPDVIMSEARDRVGTTVRIDEHHLRPWEAS